MDSHTFLANKVFGMCRYRKNTRWPLVLFILGYSVYSIEKLVGVENSNVSPDIILVNEAHKHALVIECKSGANVDNEQDSKYSHMTIGDLWKSGVPRAIHSHTPIYAINEEHASRIRDHTKVSLMVFGNSSIHGVGDFGNPKLTRELRRGITLESGAFPDVSAYPFSIRDTIEHIDARVAGAISLYFNTQPNIRGRSLATRAAAGAILREAHPLHPHFSGPHRRELRRAVERSIERQEARGAWWLGPGARRAIGP